MKPLSVLLVSAALAWPCLTARAADDATCDRYAAEATSEAAQNARRACGYSGPAWGTDPVRDYTGHLNWCLSARDDSVQKEANARRDAINKCSFCTDYAQNAVDAFKAQDKLFCSNPGGPRWSANYGGHLGWCLASDSHTAIVETGARNNLLGRCETCDAYAKDVMRQRQEAVDNKCDISGARWSSHAGGHKSWCMENGLLLVGETASSWGDNAWKFEKQARDAELKECKQCREYARTAAEQGKKARICYGLKGPLWSSSETRHFNSCMAMDDASRDAETRQQADARTKGLGECKVGVTPRPLDPAAAVRSGAKASRSGTSTLKESRPVRTDPNARRAVSGSRSSGSSAMDRLGGGPAMPDSAGVGAASRGARPAAPAARSGSGTSAPGAAINSDGFRPEQLR